MEKVLSVIERKFNELNTKIDSVNNSFNAKIENMKWTICLGLGFITVLIALIKFFVH